MESLEKLLASIERKLGYTRELIEEYDQSMDYASHCTLQGFAEGLEFVIDEIKEIQAGKET